MIDSGYSQLSTLARTSPPSAIDVSTTAQGNRAHIDHIRQRQAHADHFKLPLPPPRAKNVQKRQEKKNRSEHNSRHSQIQIYLRCHSACRSTSTACEHGKTGYTRSKRMLHHNYRANLPPLLRKNKLRAAGLAVVPPSMCECQKGEPTPQANHHVVGLGAHTQISVGVGGERGGVEKLPNI